MKPNHSPLNVAVALLFAVLISTAHAATFTVSNTNDTGAGSLRIAISNANANAGSHLIDFAITNVAATVKTITPASALPGLSKSVTIDGYSQAGASVNTLTNDDNAVLLIELSGAGVTGDGLFISVSNCVVRGLVINRFSINGISLSGSPVRHCVIEGNFIGTDPSGTIKHANGAGIFAGAPDMTIGGTTPAARNVISGNTASGIGIGGSGVTNIVVDGNFIGTDRTGTNALGNGTTGIGIATATNIVITGNVIGGNGGIGVNLGTAGNSVQGNFIGTDLTGTLNLSNASHGVRIVSSIGNQVGGAAGNLIAFNGGAGVLVEPTVPFNTNNLISGNSIYRNGSLGIDLGTAGVTTNDNCDVDTGANRLQNFPVLTASTSDAISVTIAGFLPSTASTAFDVEFFANTVCDPSGFGEGEFFIGTTNVTTGANCTNNFTVTFPIAVADALLITATATDPFGNTSEFSKCLTNVSTAATNCVTPPAGMIAWWPGDGNANDIVGSNNGSLQNGATFTAGVVAQGFSFGGGGASVSVLDAPSLHTTTQLTLDAWVLPASDANSPMIVSKFGGSSSSYELHLTPGGGLRSNLSGDGTSLDSLISGSGLILTGVWSHVATTFNAGAWKLYVNGAEVTSKNSTVTTIFPGTDALSIGRDDGLSHFFNGLIDEVEIFNRALSAAEIQSIYSAGSFGKCKNIATNDPPQITCPANVTTNTAAGTCARSVAFIATATGTPTPTISYKTNGVAVTSPVTFPKGVTTVTATASNLAGTAQCPFTVTVNDQQSPLAICPGNITSNVAAGVTSSVVDYGSINGSDNCPGVSVAAVPPSGSTFPLGTSNVTVTAIDSAGNTNTCPFTVTVAAAAPCTITCPSVAIVSNTAPGVCGATVTFAAPTTSGTCPAVSLSTNSGSFFQPGTNTVTATTNGVFACSFDIIVNDTERPHIACPLGTITSNVAAGVTSTIVDYNFSATDNCGLASSNCVPASHSVFGLGTTNVTCTVTDTSGNTTNCSFTVTVQAEAAEVHDLAILRLHVIKNINLSAATPALTKRVVVQIQNRSPHSETITNFTGLVTVELHSLTNGCVEPTADLIIGPPNNGKTLKPKQKMNVFFNVMFTTNCVPDSLKGPGHEDYRYTATVHHDAIAGIFDTHTADDNCPRAALPGGVDPNPDPAHPLKDKGCGNKNPDGTLGADVKTDVFIK